MQCFVLINKWHLWVQSALPTIHFYPQSGYNQTTELRRLPCAKSSLVYPLFFYGIFRSLFFILFEIQIMYILSFFFQHTVSIKELCQDWIWTQVLCCEKPLLCQLCHKRYSCYGSNAGWLKWSCPWCSGGPFSCNGVDNAFIYNNILMLGSGNYLPA